mgnify:CR=1 FL=1
MSLCQTTDSNNNDQPASCPPLPSFAPFLNLLDSTTGIIITSVYIQPNRQLYFAGHVEQAEGIWTRVASIGSTACYDGGLLSL